MLSTEFYRQDKELEVCLVLFQACNLNCGFCFQSRETFNSLDLNYIDEIPKKISSDLQRIIEIKKIDTITFRIWGGEIFADLLSDYVLEKYEKLCHKLQLICKNFNVDCNFCFTSNFVFKNVDRIKEFLSKIPNSYTATSYDPLYRFNTESQLQQWNKNLSIFNPSCISITLTKQNILKYITEKKHLELLKNYQVYTEYYIYSNNYDFYKPNEKNIYDFFSYCIDNKYFNVIEARNILNKNSGRYCTCSNSCLYLNGKLSFNCLKRSSSLPLLDFFNYEVPDDEKYTELQLKEALSRKKCLICKHYSYCRNFCMASILHKSYNYSQKCAFDLLYTKYA